MLIYRIGCLRETGLYVRTPENCSDVTAAVCGVGVCRFIKVHDEHAISSRREFRGARQRDDHVRLQPSVGLLRRPIVCIVVDIGNNKRECR